MDRSEGADPHNEQLPPVLELQPSERIVLDSYIDIVSRQVKDGVWRDGMRFTAVDIFHTELVASNPLIRKAADEILASIGPQLLPGPVKEVNPRWQAFMMGCGISYKAVLIYFGSVLKPPLFTADLREDSGIWRRNKKPGQQEYQWTLDILTAMERGWQAADNDDVLRELVEDYTSKLLLNTEESELFKAGAGLVKYLVEVAYAQQTPQHNEPRVEEAIRAIEQQRGLSIREIIDDLNPDDFRNS